MHIEINDNTVLKDVQNTFSDFYPYLKIEFYEKPHQKFETSRDAYRLDPASTVGQVRKTHISALLEIQPLYKVGDLERDFQNKFGFSMQVFRKEKNGWEQSAGMDTFSLKELNQLAKNSSDEYIVSDYEAGFEEPEEKPDKLY